MHLLPSYTSTAPLCFLCTVNGTKWEEHKCPGSALPALCAFPTCRVVLWSEKGELKKVVTMLMTISVTYFSRMESACFLSLVLLQACSTNHSRVRAAHQRLEFLISHCPGPSNAVTLGLCISSPRGSRARAAPGLVCWPRARLGEGENHSVLEEGKSRMGSTEV